MTPARRRERTAPMQLETQVLQHFLKQVADAKSGRVSYEALDTYLNRQKILFDRIVLRRMFDEADYRMEGSLLPKDIKDSLTGVSGGMLPTTRGIVCTAPIDVEQHINALLMSERPHSTFEGAERFRNFSDGLIVMQNIAVDTNPVTRASMHQRASTSQQSPHPSRVQSAPGGLRSWSSQRNMTEPTALCNRFDCSAMTRRSNPARQPVVAWTSTLPVTAIDMPNTALNALRAAVDGARPCKPRFELYHRTLLPDSCDLQVTLGQAMDVAGTSSLRCTEPLRPTKVLPQLNYVQWADYTPRCPTSPTKWFQEHPAMRTVDMANS